jgi:hypothetical protein
VTSLVLGLQDKELFDAAVVTQQQLSVLDTKSQLILNQFKLNTVPDVLNLQSQVAKDCAVEQLVAGLSNSHNNNNNNKTLLRQPRRKSTSHHPSHHLHQPSQCPGRRNPF